MRPCRLALGYPCLETVRMSNSSTRRPDEPKGETACQNASSQRASLEARCVTVLRGPTGDQMRFDRQYRFAPLRSVQCVHRDRVLETSQRTVTRLSVRPQPLCPIGMCRLDAGAVTQKVSSGARRLEAFTGDRLEAGAESEPRRTDPRRVPGNALQPADVARSRRVRTRRAAVRDPCERIGFTLPGWAATSLIWRLHDLRVLRLLAVRRALTEST